MALIANLRKAYPDWFTGMKVIYDAEAIFAHRQVSQRQLTGTPMSEDEIREAVTSEIHLAQQADYVVTVSAMEREIFRRHGVKGVEVIGHSIETAPAEAAFESREGLLFVGAVYKDTSPNDDSLISFLEEVYPRIRERLGNVPFTVVGVNHSDRIRGMALPPARLMGAVPRLDTVYSQARVFVAPTRYAAGIPHKIHEAAAHGLPVVATSIIAGQLGWTDHELAVADTAEAFADSCIKVYSDVRTWTALREAAISRVRRECSPEVFQDGLRRLLIECCGPEPPSPI